MACDFASLQQRQDANGAACPADIQFSTDVTHARSFGFSKQKRIPHSQNAQTLLKIPVFPGVLLPS